MAWEFGHSLKPCELGVHVCMYFLYDISVTQKKMYIINYPFELKNKNELQL